MSLFNKTALLGGAALFLAGPAAAQVIADTSPVATDRADEGAQGLEEIVVTAQKRSENVQDVPISITSFGSKELTRQGIVEVAQIARITPGLFIGRFNALRPQVYIRGVGSRVFDPGSEGSIGIFFDESYVGRFSGSLANLVDIERVEVLKGPQGTLFGRNTIGGAINITTAAPTQDLDGYFEATGGNYDQYDVRAAVSGPLSSGVRARIAIARANRGGYSENTVTGRRGNGDDLSLVRGRVQVDLGTTATFDLTAEYQESDISPWFQESTGSRQFLQHPLSPSVGPNTDRYSNAYSVDGFLSRKLFSSIGRLEWNLGPAELTAITTYRDSTSGERSDLDATERNIWVYQFREASEQFSQEFRLASNRDGFATFDNRAEWLLGAYYFRERTDRDDAFEFGADSIFHFNQPGVERANILTEVDTDSWAVFGQFAFAVTDQLKVTVGGRYTDDEKDAVIVASSTSTVPPAYVAPYRVTPRGAWSSFDPKFTIDFRPTDDILTYATVSRGFKSGGFQFNTTNATLAQSVFDPERAWTYELGLKSEWLDRRLRLNFAAFYYDYKNLQLPQFTLLPPPAAPGSGTNIISNAAQSTIKGVEFSGAAVLADGLTFTAGGTYLDAKYDRYVTGTSDFSGNRLIRSPKFQANAELDYFAPLSDTLAVRARGEWSYTSKVFFEADEGARPFTSQGGFSLFNLRLGVAARDERWTVDAWVRNLANKRYLSTIFALPVTVTQTWALPRTYGLTARFNFAR